MAAIPASVLGPWLCGGFIVALGAWHVRHTLLHSSWEEKVLAMGPLLFAAPMAVFGGEHLTVANAMASMVPRWLPAHLFWVYFVGIALEGAALSIVIDQLARLAGTLLGFMLLLFVVLIHVPGLIANGSEVRLVTVLLRDLAFAVTALAYGLSSSRFGRRTVTVARCVVGLSFLFYAWQYIPHPDFTPVTPLGLRSPGWIPWQWFWAYGIALALLMAGTMLLANWRSREGAECIGILILASVLFVYLPILIANPTDIAVALNYFADTSAIGGEALLLAGLLPPGASKRFGVFSQKLPKCRILPE